LYIFKREGFKKYSGSQGGDRFFAVFKGAKFYEGFEVDLKKGYSKIYICHMVGDEPKHMWRGGVFATSEWDM